MNVVFTLVFTLLVFFFKSKWSSACGKTKASKIAMTMSIILLFTFPGIFLAALPKSCLFCTSLSKYKTNHSLLGRAFSNLYFRIEFRPVPGPFRLSNREVRFRQQVFHISISLCIFRSSVANCSYVVTDQTNPIF